MATNFHSLRGLAIKGSAARPARNEAFVQGTINGDSMTLCFASQQTQKLSPRKQVRITTMRFQKCRRVYSPSHADFWWQPDGPSLSHSMPGSFLTSLVNSR